MHSLSMSLITNKTKNQNKIQMTSHLLEKKTKKKLFINNILRILGYFKYYQWQLKDN